VAVCDQPLNSERGGNSLPDISIIRWVLAEEDKPNWMEVCIDGTTSDYFTWLHAGHWFQADALAVMINTLMVNPRAQFVHTDHFIVHEGTILQKVNRDSNYPKDLFYTDDLCFLMRKEAATKFVTAYSGNHQLETWKKKFLSNQGIYIPQGLLLRPASDWELEIYRSAVAFSQDRIEVSGRRLEKATNIKPTLTVEEEEEIAKLHAQLILAHMKYPKNIAVIRSIDDKLGNAPELLQKQRRNIISSIAKDWFFEAVYQQKSGAVINSFMYGVHSDLSSWIKNRGVWRGLSNWITGGMY